MRFLLFFMLLGSICIAQTNTYTVSFDNAVHHEAKIQATFPELGQNPLKVRISRSSPGRYALHEFGKNVYGVQAKDGAGKTLEITRIDPHSYEISGHDGTVNLTYILFANRGDGTYAQIDETHAHLNTPAVFMFSEELEERPVEITFDIKSQPQWKIATQLKKLNENTFYAPNNYYLMDSPVEISDFSERQFTLDGQTVKFILHHDGTSEEFDEYFEKVKAVVEQQKAVFGELPNFDYGEYVFLACYLPHASGDGMEHRNSTVLTSTRSLAEGGMKGNIGTVAHEFFHIWNVERLRPQDLEPFDFTRANMSGLLWFAEGFTSYYTNLTLARTGEYTPEEYLNSITGTFNYVWNSPAREYFSPIEMSYQAPFVDAATSVDPTNHENTYISYYSYGTVLGLALDLQLRQKGQNLDDFMKLMWKNYGEPEKSYSLKDVQTTLAQYAGKVVAEEYFTNYIYKGGMPNYEPLFKNVGVKIEKTSENAFFGASVSDRNNNFYIRNNPSKGSPAYKAGLSAGDKIVSVNETALDSANTWELQFKKTKPDETMELEIERFGKKLTKKVKLQKDPTYTLSIDPKATKQAVKAREAWLSKK